MGSIQGDGTTLGSFDSARALVSDYYVNLKLGLKLDLPQAREGVLDMFDRVRKHDPKMTSFRRYRDEVALETPATESPYRWLAVRTRSVRSGVVNPQQPAVAADLHRHVLEIVPYFLSISALDVEFVETLIGLDIAARGDHDRIVAEALHAGSPMGALIDSETVVECQPVLGLKLQAFDDQEPIEVHFEVKTRSHGEEDPRAVDGPEPISVYVTARQPGPVPDIASLPGIYERLVATAMDMLDDRALPRLVVPIREAMSSMG